MTWLGVPILDWVLLVFVLGLGVEAWITIRTPDGDKQVEPAASMQKNDNSSAEND